MVRISGVDLPRNKRIEAALTYIHGIGFSLSRKILAMAGVDPNVRTENLSEGQVAKIREVIDQNYKVEGDLRKEVSMNIKRLIDLGVYRGMRHKAGLPARGQRTRTNARTRKGPRVGIKKRAQEYKRK